MLEADPNPGTRVSSPVQMEQGSEGTPGRQKKGVQVLNARSGLNIDNIVIKKVRCAYQRH